MPPTARTNSDSVLLHELVLRSADRDAGATALVQGKDSLSYDALAQQLLGFASGLVDLGLARGERVAIYLEKRVETVVASFGTPAAGAVFVPLNPLLKPEQVGYVLRDCGVRVLVTSPERYRLLAETLPDCPALRHVVLTSGAGDAAPLPGCALHDWGELLRAQPRAGHRVIETDLLSILYTSGSTGRPKGVMLSHRNMVAGAKSVASYLGNQAQDRLLAALPLSFDAGFSQLTTAFHSGASVVLLNYLMPRDVLKALAQHEITGLTAVPPLYIQLTALEWPASIQGHLRYFANTGGRMPRETLNLLRERLPRSQPFLMYGLTEAFRSTYLPPAEVDRRPDSIGKAIPNAEILVLREDGSPCAPGEPGELVHRGPLVGQGYWGDPEKTAERYKLLPPQALSRPEGLQLPEYAVFSGDTVRMDEEGFLYFIGRRDEMIKTSGYRVSPTEVEEILYATRLVGECAAFGVDDERLGQAIQVIATPPEGSDVLDTEALLVQCRARMPAYMVPGGVQARPGPLPRNPNGKIDRKLLATEWVAAGTTTNH
ncbi:acyl-CoA ligase (AMP-forming), exosortase A system-associated [Pelomonas sp. CA6]|uniref:acyl-CoA ligase (AMP-forming), exosortase A system-associated n=1 Tax=Pelomonas sp. CA6 TaxID=2907999 RepID=UPI001F4C4E72|nr:acyl-CoA ligase (AMP-forming), exosortase A system-associated [Pelomonas sp. CA6]MCH7344182.1 acyl-CoA ligase (AMP-forming), exosortase A system-associated [Pelomonas sp. CA6]